MGTHRLDPHAPKFHSLYWEMAQSAASQSYCNRHQVGAIVVTSTGMLSVGWNGAPSGLPNVCEDSTGKTLPTTLHAERNAIDKMTRQGVGTEGAILFITRAPCLECGKALQGLGLSTVHYDEDHDDMQGVELLRATGTMVIKRSAPITTPPESHNETYQLSA